MSLPAPPAACNHSMGASQDLSNRQPAWLRIRPRSLTGDFSLDRYVCFWYFAGPLPPRDAAMLLVNLARAVQHAHAHGVIHRDLKPSNILLEGVADSQIEAGEHGSLVPKIADFGLAKRLDEAGETRTGDMLGTPGYMSPESIRGDARNVGPAVDVYSLGAILYECLTGVPPFRGVTVLDTLNQAREQDPVVLSRLRPGLPRDLETICLKCLEKDPPQRYASAQDLAEDLERWLTGQVIMARPVGRLTRMRKWARRNPAGTALIGLAVLALAALGVYQWRLTQALAHAEERTRELREATARADANYRQARDTMKRIVSRSADPRHRDVPRLRELQHEQQEDALAFYLKVAEQKSDDLTVQKDVAEARFEAGRLQNELGRKDEARENLQLAADLFAELAVRNPDDASAIIRQAAALNGLAGLSPRDQGLETYTQAATLLEAVLANRPEEAEAYAELGAICHNHAGEFFATDKPKAEAMWQKAMEARQAAIRLLPDDHAQKAALAETRVNLSVLCQITNRPTEAADHAEAAADTFEEMLRRDPTDYRTLANLSSLRVNRGYVLAAAGRCDEAMEHLDRSIADLEAAYKLEPELPRLKDALYRAHGGRAEICVGTQRHELAIPSWRRVVELCPPGNRPEWRSHLAISLARAGHHAAASLPTPQ